MLHVCALHGLKFISASRNELLGNKGLDRRRPISFPHTAEKKGWLAWCEELGSFLTTLQSDPLTAGREAHKNCRDLELTGRRVADVTQGSEHLLFRAKELAGCTLASMEDHWITVEAILKL